MGDCGNRASAEVPGRETFFILLFFAAEGERKSHIQHDGHDGTTVSVRQRRQLVNCIFRSLNTSRLPNWKQGKNRIFLNCWKFKKRAENWKWIMTEFMGPKYFCLGREGVQFWWIFTIKKWKIKKGLVIVCWSQQFLWVTGKSYNIEYLHITTYNMVIHFQYRNLDCKLMYSLNSK